METSTQWGVYSEVGRLRRVLLHPPGHEHKQLLPWTKDALLFDDLLDLDRARADHEEFAQALSSRGVEVLFLVDLLKDLCVDRAIFIDLCREVAQNPNLDVEAEIRRGLRPHHLIFGWPLDFPPLDAPLFEPLPNLYFMRDPAFGVPGGMVLSRPHWPARRQESRLVGAILARHPRFAGLRLFRDILDDDEAALEGGDVHIVDARTVLVGLSERTNSRGVERLTALLFGQCGVERVLTLPIPQAREFMHLDTLLTFLDRRRVLAMPHLWSRPHLYAQVAREAKRQCEAMAFRYTGPSPESLMMPRPLMVRDQNGATRQYDDALRGLAEEGIIDFGDTVWVAGAPWDHASPERHVVEALREQWNDGANALAIKPGQVVAYERARRTIRALVEEGVDVVALPGDELVRGRGGPRCMSMPLLRDPV